MGTRPAAGHAVGFARGTTSIENNEHGEARNVESLTLCAPLASTVSKSRRRAALGVGGLKVVLVDPEVRAKLLAW